MAFDMPGAAKAQILRLDEILVPGQLAPEERSHAARSLLTLLLPEGEGRHQGGTGKALRVHTCFGEVCCLKSILVGRAPGVDSNELRRSFAAKRTSFHDEFACQCGLIGVPGIPRALGLGTYAGGPVMLMEWIEGRTLRAVLGRALRASGHARGLDALLCASIGASVAGTLQAARIRDPHFVHRDLSGLNVLVREGRETFEEQLSKGVLDLCLIDFGSSVHGVAVQPSMGAPSGAEASGAYASTPQAGASLADVGVWRNATPEYAPPEMLASPQQAIPEMRLSERVDVYGLCSVLYELYCGRTPYQLGASRPASAYLYKLQQEPRSLLPRLQGDEGFIEVMLSGLRARQAQRPSLGELREGLVAWCASQDEGLADELRAHFAEAARQAQQPRPWGFTRISHRS